MFTPDPKHLMTQNIQNQLNKTDKGISNLHKIPPDFCGQSDSVVTPLSLFFMALSLRAFSEIFSIVIVSIH